VSRLLLEQPKDHILQVALFEQPGCPAAPVSSATATPVSQAFPTPTSPPARAAAGLDAEDERFEHTCPVSDISQRYYGDISFASPSGREPGRRASHRAHGLP